MDAFYRLHNMIHVGAGYFKMSLSDGGGEDTSLCGFICAEGLCFQYIAGLLKSARAATAAYSEEFTFPAFALVG